MRRTFIFLGASLFSITMGCQLATDFDRSKIPPKAEGADNEESNSSEESTPETATDSTEDDGTFANEDAVSSDKTKTPAFDAGKRQPYPDGSTIKSDSAALSPDAKVAIRPDTGKSPGSDSSPDRTAITDGGWSCTSDNACETIQYCGTEFSCVALLANDREETCNRDRQCELGGGCCQGKCRSFRNEANCGKRKAEAINSCGVACTENQYCDAPNAACVPRLSEGASCTRDRECTSNGCCNYRCTSLTQNANCGKCGKVCGSTEFCNHGVCTPKAGYTGACTSSDQCLSEMCYDNFCGCATARDCAGEKLGTACFLGGTCGCNSDYDCKNNWRCSPEGGQCEKPGNPRDPNDPPPPPPNGSRPPR
jgi:hypothetical protein